MALTSPLPIDEEKEDWVARLKALLQEADPPRQAAIDRLELNIAQAAGDWSAEYTDLNGHSCFIVNKTLPAIMTGTLTENERERGVEFTARESGRSSVFWMSTAALMTVKALEEQGHIRFENEDASAMEPNAAADELAEQIAPAVQAEAMTATEPQSFDFSLLQKNPKAKSFKVSEGFVQRVMPLSQPWASLIPDPATGVGAPMQPVIKPGDIVEVTDALAAEVQQNNFDILWDKGNNSQQLFMNVYRKRICGWDFMLYQFDDEEQCDEWFNIHPRHIWLPPEATGVTEVEGGEYCILREPLRRLQAKRRYPEIAKKIDVYGGEDSGITPGGAIGRAYPLGSPWTDTTFHSGMIDIWTLWVRGEKFPMTEEQAKHAGRVVFEDGKYFVSKMDEEGNEVREETAPGKKNWPKRNGIRQIQMCAEVEVSNAECKYWDIPVMQNVHIPTLFRWTAQGDPQRLEWLDKLIDKLWSCLYDTVDKNRSWQAILPSDLFEDMKEQREKMNANPSYVMKVDAQLYKTYQAIFMSPNGFNLPPAPYPTGAQELLVAAMALHDVLSGNTAEAQGRASYSGQSGESQKTLQSAAKGVMSFSAVFTNAMLVRLARLRFHAFNRFATPQTWAKFNDKFPQEVLSVIAKRGKEIDVDIKANGSGESRQNDEMMVRQDVSAGLVDRETGLEKIEMYAEKADEINARMAMQEAAAAAKPVASGKPNA